MKYTIIIKIFLVVLTFNSCRFEDNEMVYEDKLVAFASISASLPVIDTIFVSKTAAIENDNIIAEDLKINDAKVRLIEDSTGNYLEFNNVGPGAYFPLAEGQPAFGDSLIIDSTWLAWSGFIIKPGSLYKLVIYHDLDSIIAQTVVPKEMNIRAADLGSYVCPDGTQLQTDTIDVNNLKNIQPDELPYLIMNPRQFILENAINVDSVTFRFGDCFTKSFASYPMFGVEFDSDNYQTIKTLTYALDANVKELEPLVNDIGEINAPSFEDPDSGMFYDYNYNKIRDFTFINLIYDTTLGFRIWKGSYFRGENNVPYRINPWQWNIEESPTQIPWLYFDYYGLNLMTFKATSESYFEYFSGDPVGQNIYLLPDSNFEGGLGVFYSSYETPFLVYVKRE